jgi:hypothetical protein
MPLCVALSVFGEQFEIFLELKKPNCSSKARLPQKHLHMSKRQITDQKRILQPTLKLGEFSGWSLSTKKYRSFLERNKKIKSEKLV